MDGLDDDVIKVLATTIGAVAYLSVCDRMRERRPGSKDRPQPSDDTIRLEWHREQARALMATMQEIGLLKTDWRLQARLYLAEQRSA